MKFGDCFLMGMRITVDGKMGSPVKPCVQLNIKNRSVSCVTCEKVRSANIFIAVCVSVR